MNEQMKVVIAPEGSGEVIVRTGEARELYEFKGTAVSNGKRRQLCPPCAGEGESAAVRLCSATGRGSRPFWTTP